MRACLKEALADGIIHKDPTFNAIAVGKVAPKDEDIKYLNYDEVAKLLKVTIDNLQLRYISRYIILFALATGARFSEIIGLTWDCVDFKNKTITINKTWDHKYKNDFDNTKNYASLRTITVDEHTLNILKDLKAKQNELALKTGLRNEKNLVFVNSKFELVTNNAVNKTLRMLCKKAKIKELTCHGLRHTHASMLLFKGVNIKYVSRRLGHKDIITTLQTYSHIMDEMEQKESRQVDLTMEELYNAK
ncbi:site-specific integrase [Thermaerobacillus caldiproteolyticus]|uniref:site-specific integrase n=1 Tax=Thermaerobacillus caldiproteolyticus TaxID=247480 RepID=UPI001F281812|nr:site-specific integrase [Anoxybacillus caldiproteolyticus]